MLKRLLNISDDKMPSLLDATDALAVALTHFYESSKPQLPKGPKSWEQFIAQNPDKIVKR
jgi:crossover junction endodeoxyribonuclease RuvC